MKVALKELGEIITGNTPSKKNDESYSSKDIGFVKPDIISDKIITEIDEVDEYISENARSKARIVSKGAILITCIGSIGKVGIITDGEYAFNQQINAIIPAKINQKYLAYNLLYNKSRLIDIANAPVVPIINKTQFGDFEISYCNNEKIQQDIVHQLDCIMSVITKRQKQLKYLDEFIKSRFVEMFGDPISNSKSWKTEMCKNVATKIGSGSTPKGGREIYIKEGTALIRSMNVYNNRFEYKDLVFITDEQAAKLSNVTIEEKDVLLNITGASVARCCLVPKELIQSRVNQHVSIIRCTNKLKPEFLVYMFTGDAYQKKLWEMAINGGATREAITKKSN